MKRQREFISRRATGVKQARPSFGSLARLSLAAALIGVQSLAVAAVIDFEGLSDSEAVTTQFTGLAFSHSTVLTAGNSLNEFESRQTSSFM